MGKNKAKSEESKEAQSVGRVERPYSFTKEMNVGAGGGVDVYPAEAGGQL